MDFLQKPEQKIDGDSSIREYKLSALAEDLHRKFDKSVRRGQSSDIQELQEEATFTAAMSDQNKLITYFSLFADTKQKAAVQEQAESQPSQLNCRQ